MSNYQNPLSLTLHPIYITLEDLYASINDKLFIFAGNTFPSWLRGDALYRHLMQVAIDTSISVYGLIAIYDPNERMLHISQRRGLNTVEVQFQELPLKLSKLLPQEYILTSTSPNFFNAATLYMLSYLHELDQSTLLAAVSEMMVPLLDFVNYEDNHPILQKYMEPSIRENINLLIEAYPESEIPDKLILFLNYLNKLIKIW